MVTWCEKYTFLGGNPFPVTKKNCSLFGCKKRSSFLVEGKMVASSTLSKTNAKQNAWMRNEITRPKMCLNLRISNPLLLRFDSLCNLPSRELTYAPKMAFWRWFSFSQGGICEFPGGYIEDCPMMQADPEMWKPRLWNARTKALTSTYRCLTDEFFEDIFPWSFRISVLGFNQKSQGRFSFACWVVEYYQLVTYQHCWKGCWNSWYFFKGSKGPTLFRDLFPRLGVKCWTIHILGGWCQVLMVIVTFLSRATFPLQMAELYGL